MDTAALPTLRAVASGTRTLLCFRHPGSTLCSVIGVHCSSQKSLQSSKCGMLQGEWTATRF